VLPFLRYSALNNGVTLKSGLGVTQDRLKWYHSTDREWVPIGVPW